MMKEHKEVHWFERLEADTAGGKNINISKEEWQILRKHLGFENHITESYQWVYEISLVLGNTNEPWWAYHALRGVLHSLRDRMSVEEVFQFAAQMPVHIRGIFFEGYSIAGKPQKFHVDELLERIDNEMGPKNEYSPKLIFKAILQVLYHHITEGELKDVYATLPKDIRKLWDEIHP